MKCILLLTLVALCYSAPRDLSGQGNVHVNEDGSIAITQPSGKQVTIAKVQGIAGQSAIAVSATSPNIPTKIVHIVSPSQPSVLSNVAGQQQAQNLLNAISSAVQDSQLDNSDWEVLQNFQVPNPVQLDQAISAGRGLGQVPVNQQVLPDGTVISQLQNGLVTISSGGVTGPSVVQSTTPTVEVPVNQQVLPDGTVISQLQNGFITISSGGVTGPSVVTQMGKIGEPVVSSGSSLSNILGGWEGQRSVQLIISEVVQKEREILQVQALLQQQQLQLQQRQQELQLQQAQQQQQQQNVQQGQLLQQLLEQQQLQENPTLQQALNQNSAQRRLQKLIGVPTQMRSIGSQWKPTVVLTQGTSAIPVQRLT